jgi:uncharacterized protein (TIRG00374 family)
LKKSFLSAIKYILLLAIGVGLMYLAFHGHDLKKMLQDIESANYFWVLFSLFVSLLAYISRAMRWNMLIESLGYKPKLRNTYWALLFGYFANLAIPRLGEVSRCGALSRKEKIPFNELLGTVVIERVIDLLMLVVSIILVSILEFGLLRSFAVKAFTFHLYPVHSSLLLFVNSWLFVALMLSPLLLLIMLQLFFRWQQRNETATFKKISNLVLGIIRGFQTILKMKNNWKFVAHTFFIWTMYFIVSYVCFFAIPATSGLSPKDGLFIFCIGGMGMTAPVQGGFGIYHLLVSQALTLFGIPLSDGLVYATIVHTSQTLLVLLMGGISVIYFLNPNKNVL